MNKRIIMLMLGDVAAAAAALYVGHALRFLRFDSIEEVLAWLPGQLPVFAVTLIVAAYLVELYNADRNLGIKELMVRTFIGLVVSFMIFSILYFFISSISLGRGILGWSLCAFGVLHVLWHIAVQELTSYEGFASRVLILGTGPLALKVGEIVKETNHNHVLSGYLRCSDDSDSVPAQAIIGSASCLSETVRREHVRKVVVSLSERRGALPVKDMMDCKFNGISVIDAPTFYEELTGKLLLENVRPSWFIFSDGFRLSHFTMIGKRAMDIVMALLVGIAALPVLAIIPLLIVLDSPGPVLYGQQRIGQRERKFMLYKFRTMRKDAENGTGAVWARKDDDRVTRLGKVLRKTRLDELPQLYNVLKGDMSFIGPRPERPEFVSDLKKVIPYYSERHSVKPGITGWAQIKYPYGASVEDAVEKLRYDLYYLKNFSFFLDILIALETTKVVLFGRGGR